MKKLICLFLTACLVFTLGACAEKTPVKSDEEEFRVITSFYPVYVAPLNLVSGAEDVTLINLTQPDVGCMHDYTLTTEDIEKMTGADLFIASGMGMESFVGKTSMGIPRLETLECGEDAPNIIGDEDDIQNSHYWMDIENAINQCEKIKRTLLRLDPKNSAVYEKNAAEYTEKLSSLLEEAKTRAKGFGDGSATVYHDSLEYFTKELGIGYVTILSDADLDEYLATPGATEFSHLLVQESLIDSEEVKKICNVTGCTPISIDTLTSGTEDGNDKDAYINAVRHNLDVIEQVLG
ncbi:MAG: metal ABC transporter substrate-binding protein [Oscillospiraceae bacterium]|nr:metal ABC transporter substrate-binding protein [Oscillospiraceae bacterium]